MSAPRPQHCLSCTCTPTSSASPRSYHTPHTSPQAPVTPTQGHMAAHPLPLPIHHPPVLPPATIASVMHAVYFSTGSFADAVEAVRNDPRLWPYRRARQSENAEEQGREWRGMVAVWRERLKGEGQAGGDEGERKESGNENGNGNEKEKPGQRMGLERAAEDNGLQPGEGVQEEQTEHAPKQEGVEKKQRRQPRSKNEEAEQETPREMPASRPTPISTCAQPIQPTWTRVQLKNQSARPAPVTLEATQPQPRPQPQQIEAAVPVPEQRRTGLDIYEFEAWRPMGEW